MEIKIKFAKRSEQNSQQRFGFSKIYDRHHDWRIFIGLVWILLMVTIVKRFPFISQTIIRCMGLICINVKFSPLPINVRFLIVINWQEAQYLTLKLFNVNLKAISFFLNHFFSFHSWHVQRLPAIISVKKNIIEMFLSVVWITVLLKSFSLVQGKW